MNRRTFLAASAAACFAAPAHAQALNFDAAAAYSAERRGVSLLVMQRGQTIFEDWVEERVKEGRSIFGLYPPNPETRAEFEAWKKKR